MYTKPSITKPNHNTMTEFDQANQDHITRWLEDHDAVRQVLDRVSEHAGSVAAYNVYSFWQDLPNWDWLEEYYY